MAAKDFELGRLKDCTFDETLQLWNRGFSEYYSDMTMEMSGMMRHIARHNISPAHSVVAFVDGKPAGFVFIGMKTVSGEKLAWNGGTGLDPAYRGRGIGKAMMAEVEQVLRAEEVDIAYLEVVSKNIKAIRSYENGGFNKDIRLAGKVRTGAIEGRPFQYDEAELKGWRLEAVQPIKVSQLPFYRKHAAWDGQWHQFQPGQVSIVYDDAGEPATYAFYRRNLDAEGNLSSVVLHQFEVRPGLDKSKKALYGKLLTEIYGPLDVECTRSTGNLPMTCPLLLQLLEQAGFKEKYEQFLMIWRPL